jgi:hypothetical protein
MMFEKGNLGKEASKDTSIGILRLTENFVQLNETIISIIICRKLFKLKL